MKINLIKKEDYKRVMEFNSLVHGEESFQTLENVIFNNPFHKLENFAYIEEQGKIIAFTGLIIHEQRFGSEKVKVGEIGVVGTDPEYRKKGYSSKLMNYWTEYMKKNNIHFSFLFGIPDYYQQFHYEYAVPAHFTNYANIDVNLLKSIKGNYTVEELEEKDIDRVNSIYEMCCKDNFCTEIRSFEYWKYRIDSTSFNNHKWYVVKDGKSIKGYFWLTNDDKEVTIREVGILDEEAGKSITEFLYEISNEKKEVKCIGIKGPLNNLYIQYLYKKGAELQCNNEIYPGTWAGMYKIVNFKESLKVLTEEFEKRLKESKFFNHSGKYAIKSEIGKTAIVIESGKVKIVDNEEDSTEIYIHYSKLTQMIIGYKTVESSEINITHKENLNDSDINEIYKLVKVLFPVGYPYIFDLEMSDELE